MPRACRRTAGRGTPESYRSDMYRLTPILPASPSGRVRRPCVRRILGACALAIVLLAAADADAARDGYYPGDWVSWTSMRRVNDIEETQNVLYVATDGGVARYDIADERWLRPFTLSDGLISRGIAAIMIDPATRDLVYMTPDGAIAAFMLFNERPNPAFQATPEVREQLRRSIHSLGRYPNAFAPPGYAFTPDGILSDDHLRQYQTMDRVIDFWDNVWLAIRGYGIAVREHDTARLRLLPYSLWNDDLRAIDSYGDNFWFVGPGAINVHHRDLDAWAKFEAYTTSRLLSDDAADVLVESTQVWLATSAGLSRYDGRAGQWRTFTPFDGLPDENVRCIAADTGSIWIGTAFGVARLDRKASRAVAVSHGDWAERTIHDIAVAQGAVWIGTDAGVFRSDDRGATWTRFTGGQPLLDAPTFIIEAGEDELWFATRLGVIGYDARQGAWERYPLPHYFSADDDRPVQFLSLLPDRPIIWVGTDRGVFKGDRNRGTWRQFTAEDGLIDDRVMDMELDEDYIWFATPGGATRFYWNSPRRVD